MPDQPDDIDEKAQKYGWSPEEVAHLRAMRNNIPGAPAHPLAQNPDPYQNFAEKVEDPNRANLSEGGEVNPRLEALKRLKSR